VREKRRKGKEGKLKKKQVKMQAKGRKIKATQVFEE
jgi:hypothetical protein